MWARLVGVAGGLAGAQVAGGGRGHGCLFLRNVSKYSEPLQPLPKSLPEASGRDFAYTAWSRINVEFGRSGQQASFPIAHEESPLPIAMGRGRGWGWFC